MSFLDRCIRDITPKDHEEIFVYADDVTVILIIDMNCRM